MTAQSVDGHALRDREDDHAAPRAAAKLGAIAVVLFAFLLLLGVFLVKIVSKSGFGHSEAGVDRSLAQHRTGWLNSATYWLTEAAQTTTVIGVAVLSIVVLYAVTRRWHKPLFVVVTLAGEVAIFLLVTLLVHRHRPDASLELDKAPPTSSFPSGHTAASVAMYGGLAVLAWRAQWRRVARLAVVVLLALIPFLVAFSRVYRGMHFPTDVLGGMFLGGLWLSATTMYLLPRRR